jgi:cell wall-associated NlpC family hydrolase
MGTLKGIRLTVALGAVALTSLCALPASAAATAPPASAGAPVATLARTLVLALGPRSTSETVARIGDSLALMEARRKVEAIAARNAAEAGSEAGDEAASEEVVSDPAKMPPASAGSNGTAVPHTSHLSRDQIFAHSRGGEPGSTAILLTGVALAPTDAPAAVQGVIDNANAIVGRPYIWGGGHGSFYSRGYDCSGAVSFALFGGGLIPEPLASTGLEHWGAPGPGKWITVYANAEHAFAEIAGLRFDTVGDAQGTGPRWHLAPTDTSGFVARHPPGL